MLNLAVIGKDVSKSLSPAMHEFLLRGMGESCRYDAVSIPPSEFSSRAEALFEMYDGFNVTIPYKGSIIPYLNRLCGDASTFGAVNTVVTGVREGYNTDGSGFMLMLENAGVEAKGSALVLGAGGAGRSCIAKLAEAGMTVFAYERDGERLKKVSEELGCFTPLADVKRKFDLIVNCTGVGMHDTVGKTPEVMFGGVLLPVGEELLSLCGAAVDLIYEPAQSEFLRRARALHIPAIPGGAMLFYQAYFADCIYLGKQPSASEAKTLYQQFTEENR